MGSLPAGRQGCPIRERVMSDAKNYQGNLRLSLSKHVSLSACRQARTMKIINPPLPPFSKGGEGGFESY
jgi:hypothetical protein